MYFVFSTKYFIILGKVADQGHRGLARTNARTSYCTQTTRNTKTSTLTVTLLINTIERIRRIATAITVAPKEAWVPFVFNFKQSSFPSSEEIFITVNSLCSALWKSKSLLSHWLPATQILRLSNLIHILLFKLLSILHVHSWHYDSDLSLGLWGPFQFFMGAYSIFKVCMCQYDDAIDANSSSNWR